MEARTVSHRRGHGDHRISHQPADDAGQCALHAGHGDHAVCAGDGFLLRQEPVDARHAHVVNALHPGTEIFRRLRRFLRHGNVRRAGRADRHPSHMGLVRFFLLQDARDRVIGNIGDLLPHQLILMRRGPRAEDLAVRLIKLLVDRRQIGVRLAGAEDHLFKAGPRLPARIQLCVAQLAVHFLLPPLLKIRFPFLDGKRSVPDLFQQFPCIHSVSFRTASSILPMRYPMRSIVT